MSKVSRTLLKAYNCILKATELKVKEISPKLNLNKYILCEDTPESTLVKNMNELTLFVRNPGCAYLYLSKKK